jgi:hypothetical protein
MVWHRADWFHIAHDGRATYAKGPQMKACSDDPGPLALWAKRRTEGLSDCPDCAKLADSPSPHQVCHRSTTVTGRYSERSNWRKDTGMQVDLTIAVSQLLTLCAPAFVMDSRQLLEQTPRSGLSACSGGTVRCTPCALSGGRRACAHRQKGEARGGIQFWREVIVGNANTYDDSSPGPAAKIGHDIPLVAASDQRLASIWREQRLEGYAGRPRLRTNMLSAGVGPERRESERGESNRGR